MKGGAMTHKFNPFKPASPVYTGMFAGRSKELGRIDQILYQTKHGNPTHILITGERGIGKSSLMLVTNYFSEGKLEWKDDKYNFLTVQVTINKGTGLIDFADRIHTLLVREFQNDNKVVDFLNRSWGFVKNFEVAGVAYKNPNQASTTQKIIDNLVYSLVDTVKNVTEENLANNLGLSKMKDGVVILIDEADSATKELDLGSFLKNLSETLVSENCNKVLLVLVGLPRIRDVLRESHESSLRLFEEFELFPLSKEEVSQVVKKGLDEANSKSDSTDKITITDEALNAIYGYSEGYPHFIQQVGYSAFDTNTDNKIDEQDVVTGALKKNGAIDLIGNRYYIDLFYNKIKVESFRDILNIMAQNWDGWISKEQIRKSFKGGETALTNGLRALKDRSIILCKEGVKGIYRLQWKSFAFWIKNHNRQIKENVQG